MYASLTVNSKKQNH